MTPDALLSRRKGQALNAEEALAARQILAKSGNELVNAARAIQRLDQPGDDLLVEFQRKLTRHAALQEQVSGGTAEAGRALSQFRMVASSQAVRRDVLAALVNRGGGADRIKNAADILVDAVEGDPGKFNTLAKQLTKPGWQDKFSELYINYLLSAPPTHIVNTVSNTLTALGQLPEHATAAVLGGARAALGRGEDRVIASEVGARAFGLLQGTREGIGEFAKTMRTGEPSDFASKIEAQSLHAIKGVKGSILRTPTRLLMAEDELFKGMARRMELNGLAVRKAHKEGLRGEAAKARIAELVANPTDEMMERAFDYGRYLTFQRPLGALSGGIARAKQEVPLLNLIVTFIRTPTNLLKFAVERSPAAPLVKEWRRDFAAGGARRDLAIAKALVGTGFGATIYQLAHEGKITGSAPSDPAKNRFMRADGWQPYSFEIGGKFYSYSRLDPFATTMGVAADLATKADGMSTRQLDEYSMLLVASIMKSLGDKTWLSGASDFIEAIGDPERHGMPYLRRIAGSITIPNLVGHTARTLDPTARDTRSIGDELQARIPGLSDDLPAKRDIWGEPIVNEGGLGPNFLSPFRTSTAKNDPVNAEMLALDARVGPPQKSYKVDGKPVEWSPQQYERLSELSGKAAREGVSSLVDQPGWDKMTPEAKLKAIGKVFTDARAGAKAEVLGLAGDARKRAAPRSGKGTTPPPPDGFRVDGDAGGVNVYADLQKAIPGVQFTSGFRDYEYNQRLKARGYQAADNTTHMDGDTLDMLPPPGKSLGWLRSEVQRRYPDAKLLVHDGHLHGRFPGYYGAPVLGGAKSAGIKNPWAGMPPPPPGFRLDAR
jgi:hypothetical protein